MYRSGKVQCFGLQGRPPRWPLLTVVGSVLEAGGSAVAGKGLVVGRCSVLTSKADRQRRAQPPFPTL